MPSSVDRPRRGRGRPAGGGDRVALILDAARHEFAAQGYDAVSMRAIARAAGVDPALVHHYFDGKEALFVAAMQLPFHPGEVLPALFAGAADADEVAERMVRFIFSIWRESETRAPFLALLRSATGSETAAALMRDFVSQALFARLADHLPARARPAAAHQPRRGAHRRRRADALRHRRRTARLRRRGGRDHPDAPRDPRLSPSLLSCGVDHTVPYGTMGAIPVHLRPVLEVASRRPRSRRAPPEEPEEFRRARSLPICATWRSSPTSTTARPRWSTPCSGSPARSGKARTSRSA